MAKKINILFITGSNEDFESCTRSLPTGIKAIRSSSSENELNSILSDYKPVAVFIIFAKGERVKKMNLDYLFSYIEGYGIRLFAIGSPSQVKSLREMYCGDLLCSISPGDIRRKALSIKSDNTTNKKKLYDKSNRKNIAILSADMITASICEDALDADDCCNRARRYIYIDMRIWERLIPRLMDMPVHLFILSDSGEIAERAVTAIKEYFPKTPCILLQRDLFSTLAEDKRCICVDISKDNFAVRSTVESILNEE